MGLFLFGVVLGYLIAAAHHELDNGSFEKTVRFLTGRS